MHVLVGGPLQMIILQSNRLYQCQNKKGYQLFKEAKSKFMPVLFIIKKCVGDNQEDGWRGVFCEALRRLSGKGHFVFMD